MKNIKELKPVLHFKKDNYVYRYVLVDRFKHGPKYHYGFDIKEERSTPFKRPTIVSLFRICKICFVFKDKMMKEFVRMGSSR